MEKTTCTCGIRPFCGSSTPGLTSFPLPACLPSLYPPCSVRDVQRIGIFDIRLFNTDRHAGNMLVRRPPPRASASSSVAAPQRLDGAALLELAAWELVPIDHGFALPEALEPPYFEWQHWPQAMLPFGREELDYIAALDAKADIRMLRQEVGGWVAAGCRHRPGGWSRGCWACDLPGWLAVDG